MGPECGDLTILDSDTRGHMWCKSIFGKLNSLWRYKTWNGTSVVCNFNFAILLQSFRLKRTHWDRLGVVRDCLTTVNIQLAQKRAGTICPFVPSLWRNLDSFTGHSVKRFPLFIVQCDIYARDEHFVPFRVQDRLWPIRGQYCDSVSTVQESSPQQVKITIRPLRVLLTF